MMDAVHSPGGPTLLRGNGFRVEHVMGMPISIDIRDRTARTHRDEVDELLDSCFATLHEADDVFSLWRPGTPMARLSAREAALTEMPSDVLAVLRLCVRNSTRTGGLFTARRPDGRVDPTGLVKGWAVARVGRRLLNAGIRHWCINAAGDVLVHGQARPGEGWAVGVADPTHPGRLLDTVTLTTGAVATSGSAERGRHIWDPVAGGRAHGILAATVVGRDLVRADVMATAAVARGAGACTWLETIRGVEGLVVHDDGTVEATSGWPGDG